DPAARGYMWRRDTLEPPPRLRTGLGWLKARVFGPPPDPPTCKTNNYAFVHAPEHLPLLMNHMRASEHVDANPAAVKRLAATLAIQNRNLASQTALGGRKPTLSRERLLVKYGRYRDLYAKARVPAWARPYVAMMAELMREARPA